MKLTVLMDNNTYIDQYYYGEPAVCYYIEDGDARILLDTGYSDMFIRNAKALQVDLNKVTTIVISHGHNDHTGGLPYLADYIDLSTKTVLAHPDAFKKTCCDGEDIGSPLSAAQLESICKLTLSNKPVKISDHIIFLGEIPAYNKFENRKPIGVVCGNATTYDDIVMDDTALVYKSDKGLFIITGCSHSGICNIIEHAKIVCNENKVLGVIGGFHLFEASSQLKKTIQYFKENNLSELYPCHCVSFIAKAEIHRHIPIKEVGVGMIIEI